MDSRGKLCTPGSHPLGEHRGARDHSAHSGPRERPRKEVTKLGFLGFLKELGFYWDFVRTLIFIRISLVSTRILLCFGFGFDSALDLIWIWLDLAPCFDWIWLDSGLDSGPL